MLIDFSQTDKSQRYHLMSSIVVPRPVAWVSTFGVVDNIAPFSYFTPLSSQPPTVMISIGHKADGSAKDTLRNLRENNFCSISIVDEAHILQMHRSGESLKYDKSEFERFDIPKQSIIDGYPPVPQGIKAVLFGRYIQEVDLKGSATIPVIIEIEHIYIDDDIIADSDKLKVSIDSIARMGGSYRVLGREIKI